MRVNRYFVLGTVVALTGCGGATRRTGETKLPGSGTGPLTQRIPDDYSLAVDRCSPGDGTCRLTFANGRSLKCSGVRLRVEETEPGVVVRGGTCVKAPVARIARTSARCSAAQLVLSERPTGGSIGVGIEGPFDFVLTNHSASTCGVDGFPRLILSTHVKRLPFGFEHGGRAVSRHQPRPLALAPEAEAFFKLIQGRCETGRGELATGLRLLLPGASGEIRTALPRPPFYCLRRPNYGAPVIGNVMSVSPIAASLVEAGL